jgi:hypothetical protein
VRIVLRSTDPERLAAAGGEFLAMVAALGGQAEDVEVTDR